MEHCIAGQVIPRGKVIALKAFIGKPKRLKITLLQDAKKVDNYNNKSQTSIYRKSYEYGWPEQHCQLDRSGLLKWLKKLITQETEQRFLRGANYLFKRFFSVPIDTVNNMLPAKHQESIFGLLWDIS